MSWSARADKLIFFLWKITLVPIAYIYRDKRVRHNSPGFAVPVENWDKSQLSTGTIVGLCSSASSYINNTPNNFSMLTIKKLVLNCFISIAELSLVEITPRWRYQMKIFIFSGILSFQINLFRNGVPWFIRNRTLKWSCLCKFQVKVSLSFKSCLTGEFSY